MTLHREYRAGGKTYHDLLRLREVVKRVAVELNLAQPGYGHIFLRDDLGGIEKIEAEAKLIFFLHYLDTELQWGSAGSSSSNGEKGRRRRTHLPLGISSSLNRVEQILTHKVLVLTGCLLRLFPEETSAALQRTPVELDQLGGAVVGHETERVNTEAVNVPEGTRDSVTRHGPEDGMQRAGLAAEEVPSRVVSSSGLRDLVVCSGLDGVYEIGEENGVLDEEDRHVVPDDI